MSTQELERSLEAIAESRRGEHPEPNELLAYYLGECPSREAESIEDHLVFCSECAGHVLDMDRFSKGEMAREVEPMQDSRILGLPGVVGSRRLSWNLATIPLGFYQAAALIFFICSAALAGYILTTSPGKATGALGQAVANVPILELSSLKTRSVEDAIVLKEDVAGAILVIPLAAIDTFPRYELTFTNENEEVLLVQSDLRRTQQGLLTLVVPRDFLPHGDYFVAVVGISFAGERHELNRFRVRWRSET